MEFLTDGDVGVVRRQRQTRSAGFVSRGRSLCFFVLVGQRVHGLLFVLVLLTFDLSSLFKEKQSAAWRIIDQHLSIGPFKLTSLQVFFSSETSEGCSGLSSFSSFLFLASGSSEASVDLCGELLLVLFVLFEYSRLKQTFIFQIILNSKQL